MLKKIVLTLALVGLAANAFAAASITIPAGITFVPSKNVILGYNPDVLGGVSKVVYSIASKNTAGDKIYGATSASSAIGFKVSSAGTTLATGDLPTPPTTISDSTLDNGFSVL